MLVKADDLPTTLALLRGDDIPLDGPSAGADEPDEETDVWVDTDDPAGIVIVSDMLTPPLASRPVLREARRA